MTARRALAAAMIGILTVAVAGSLCCKATKRALVKVFDVPYEAAFGVLEPHFDGPDSTRVPIGVSLVPVADGLPQITDIQFPPGQSELAVVLSKGGTATWIDLAHSERGTLLEVDVRADSELGLLGLAFHPDFQDNGRFYVNYTPADKPLRSRVAAWNLPGADFRAASPVETGVVLEVAQPYQNHDGGQLAFGPDGMLFIGWGDGGFRADPDDNGQDGATLLGAMLRLDVDQGDPYQIPQDNPFVGDPAVRDEIWAIGLRNPWRYSFDPSGRLVVADVGQDEWEEVSIVSAGDNLGWNLREGRHCYPPRYTCDPTA